MTKAKNVHVCLAFATDGLSLGPDATLAPRRKIRSREWRYYISSHDFGAAQFNQAIREHWTTENEQHWTLDVVYREDDSRIRVGPGYFPASGA